MSDENVQRNWSVELRPCRLSEMVGQDELVQNLRDQFGDGSVPIGTLLTGGFGTGKTTIARILAVSVQCTHSSAFGEPCDGCLENEDLFNIEERNCADMTTLESVQDFLPRLRSYPNFGRFRVVILDEAQQMSDKAQQAWLKPMEVKDSSNLFIFGTSNGLKINKAIKDRCRPFAIPEMNPRGVAALVQSTAILGKQRFGTPDRDLAPLIKVLHTAYISSARNIVTATEMYLKGMKPEQAIVIKDAGDVDYYALARCVGQGNWEMARTILAKAKPADGDEIKMRICAYFRDRLLENPRGSRADLLSEFIRELAGDNSIIAGLQLSTVVSDLYRICQTVNQVKLRRALPALAQVGTTDTIQ